MTKNNQELDELIIIKTNQTKKVKKFLDKEHIDYRIYNSEVSHKAKNTKTHPRRSVEEAVKLFDKARIKY